MVLIVIIRKDTVYLEEMVGMVGMCEVGVAVFVGRVWEVQKK